MFQHYAAFKHLSVRRNVAFGLEIRKRPKDEIRERVDELLELVHLEQFADRLPSQLSGGQRQRMALARALAVEPTVLLLDEPFGALDAKVRKELRDWLRRLHDEVHVTTVFVTHDQEEALEVADEIVVINEGRVEQIGSPDELYDQPANDFVMRFLGPVTQLGDRLVRPHDLQLHTGPAEPGDVTGRITRITRIGFEMRVEVTHGRPGRHRHPAPQRVPRPRRRAGLRRAGPRRAVRPHPARRRRHAAPPPAPHPPRRSRADSGELISDHENCSLIALLCSGTRTAAGAPAQGRRAHCKIALSLDTFRPSCGRKVSKIPAFNGESRWSFGSGLWTRAGQGWWVRPRCGRGSRCRCTRRTQPRG